MFTTTIEAICAAFARQCHAFGQSLGEVVMRQPDLRRYLQLRHREGRGSKLGRRLRRKAQLGRQGSF